MTTMIEDRDLLASVLDLNRPLCIFDLEATGTDVDKDRIIQIGLVRLTSDGEETTYEQKIDPQRSVPGEVEELTGITTQELTFAPTFADAAPTLMPYFRGADVAGYNLKSYDFPLLKNEMERAGQELPLPDDRSVLDVYEMEKYCRSLALEAVYERYTGEELEGAHEALADVSGTAEVLGRQIEEFDLPSEVEAIIDEMSDGYIDQKRRLYRDDHGAMRVDFGKFGDQNRSVEWILKNEPGYLKWMMEEINELREHFANRLDELGYSRSDLS